MNNVYGQTVMLKIIVVLIGFSLGACDTTNENGNKGETEGEIENENQPDASTTIQDDDGNPSLLRMVYILRRIPELSLNEFREHWRDVHAPIVLKHKETLGIHGYAQLHNAQPAGNQAMQGMRGTMKCYDGVSEFTIDRAKLEQALETVEGQIAMDELIEDERLFVDFAQSSIWFAEEHVIVRDTSYVPPSPANRLTWVGSGLKSLTMEEFQDHYLNNHAPLVAGYADVLGIRDYIQIHTIDDPLGEALRQLRGTMKEPYGIHAEFYWNLGAINSPEALNALTKIQEDERKFIDFSRSAIWNAQEHIFLP